MEKIVLFVALFGMATSLNCTACIEMSATGTGADLFNAGMQAAGLLISCDSPTQQVCNAAIGEDACKAAEMEVSLSGDVAGVTYALEMELNFKGCTQSNITCDALEEASTAGMKAMGYTVDVTECKISGAVSVYTGVLVSTVLVLVQLF